MILGSYKEKLCLCDWRYRKMRSAIDKRIKNILQAEYSVQQDTLLDYAMAQLTEYFAQQRQQFDMPLLFAGTHFQKQVWRALCKIAYSDTSSYLQLAQRIGNEKAVRAVAAANGANAISIIVPCHRIIGSSGKLVGYAGGLAAKEKLLKLENKVFSA